MLQNAYSLAKIGACTAENERNFVEILEKIGKYPTGPLPVRRSVHGGVADRPRPPVRPGGGPPGRAGAGAPRRARRRAHPSRQPKQIHLVEVEIANFEAASPKVQGLQLQTSTFNEQFSPEISISESACLKRLALRFI